MLPKNGESVRKYARFMLVGIIIAASFISGYIIINTVENQTNIKGNTLIDDFNRTVFVPEDPNRIISLAPSITEILFVLELGDRIVGVDDNSDYPEEVKNIERVGGWIINEEKIISLNPDLILASDMTSASVVNSLEQKSLTVFCVAPRTIEEILQDIRILGLITNKVDLATSVTDGLKQRIDAVTAITSNSTLNRPKVYLEYYPYWTFGPGSFGNDLILMAGGQNIAATTTTEYPMISNEFVVGSNPEFIIFTEGMNTNTTVDTIRNRPGWGTTDAVKNNKIFVINDDLLSRPGPRIVDALEEFAHLIHPVLFP